MICESESNKRVSSAVYRIYCIFKFASANFVEMPNALDKIMDQRKKLSSPGAGGRPMHEHWSGYAKIYVKGKVAAKCLNCSKTLPNTAKARLAKHR